VYLPAFPGIEETKECEPENCYGKEVPKDLFPGVPAYRPGTQVPRSGNLAARGRTAGKYPGEA